MRRIAGDPSGAGGTVWLGLTIFRGTVGVLIGCVLAMIVMLTAGFHRIWVFGVAFVAIALLLILPLLWLFNRPILADIRRIKDEHLVHWSYPIEEWRQFERRSWKHAVWGEGRLWKVNLVATLTVSGWVILAAVAGFAIVTLVVGVIAGLGLWVASYLIAERLGLSRHAEVTGTVVDVYVSERGVLKPGSYMPLRAFNLSLQKVAIEEGPPATLRFTTISTGYYTTGNEIRIPIPSGREDEARQLVAHLMSDSAAA